MAGIARAAHEAQHALRFGDAEIVGRLVKDDQVAVEMHGARDRHRLPLAARQRADRRRRRDVLGDADLPDRSRATVFIASWSMRFKKRGDLIGSRRGTGCARSTAA